MIMQEAPRRPPASARAPIPPPSQAGLGRSPGSIQRAPAIQRIQQPPGVQQSQQRPAFAQPQPHHQNANAPRQGSAAQQALPPHAQPRAPQPHAPQQAPASYGGPRAPSVASPNRGAPMRPLGTVPVEMSPQPPPVYNHAPPSGGGQPRHDVHFDHRPDSQAQRFAPQPISQPMAQRGASQFPPPQQRVSQFPPPQAQHVPYPSQAPPAYGPQGFSPMPPPVHSQYAAPVQSFAPTPNPPNVRYAPSQAPPGFPSPSLPPHFAPQQQGVPSAARPSAFPGRRRSSAPPSESLLPIGPVPPQAIMAASMFLGLPLALAVLVVAVLALR